MNEEVKHEQNQDNADTINTNSPPKLSQLSTKTLKNLKKLTTDAITQRVLQTQYNPETALESKKTRPIKKLKSSIRTSILKQLKDNYPLSRILFTHGISQPLWLYYEERARTGKSKQLAKFFKEVHEAVNNQFKPIWDNVAQSKDPRDKNLALHQDDQLPSD